MNEKPTHPSEERICRDFMAHVRQAKKLGLAAPGLTVFHIPNGQRAGKNAKLRAIQGGRDKAIGALAGVYDYFAMWNGGLGFLEAKRHDGSLSEEQEDFAELCYAADIQENMFRSAIAGVAILVGWNAIDSRYLDHPDQGTCP